MIQHLGYWVFLAVASFLHWTLPSEWRARFLAAACLGFIFVWQPESAMIYLVLALTVYVVLAPPGRPRPWAAWAMAGALAFCLAWFKVVPTRVAEVSLEKAAALGLIPLGLSYFIFKLIHFIIEVRRRVIREARFGDFLAYLFLLPMFTAGPIERFDHFLSGRLPALDRKTAGEAGTRVIIGLVKKYLIVEGFLHLAFHEPRLSVAPADLTEAGTWRVWAFAALSYLRVYLDFSAYSDIALGTALFFGYRLAENFNFPILAANPSEFWRRWHISLSSWCQNYIYMPALGVFRHPFLPILLAFLVMGLWHAISWNRVGWAVYQTAGIVVFMIWSRSAGRAAAGGWRLSPAWRGCSILLTQVFIIGSLVFFMNGEDQSLALSLQYLRRLSGLTAP
jgi:alginate O-acetyltransferase complex protein AlgI